MSLIQQLTQHPWETVVENALTLSPTACHETWDLLLRIAILGRDFDKVKVVYRHILRDVEVYDIADLVRLASVTSSYEIFLFLAYQMSEWTLPTATQKLWVADLHRGHEDPRIASLFEGANPEWQLGKNEYFIGLFETKDVEEEGQVKVALPQRVIQPLITRSEFSALRKAKRCSLSLKEADAVERLLPELIVIPDGVSGTLYRGATDLDY